MYEQNIRVMLAGTILPLYTVQRFVMVMHTYMQLAAVTSLESVNEPNHKEK